MVLDDGPQFGATASTAREASPAPQPRCALWVKTLPPAMLEAAHELQAKGIDSTLAQDKQNHRLRLEILHGEEVDFVYEVRLIEGIKPCLRSARPAIWPPPASRKILPRRSVSARRQPRLRYRRLHQGADYYRYFEPV